MEDLEAPWFGEENDRVFDLKFNVWPFKGLLTWMISVAQFAETTSSIL